MSPTHYITPPGIASLASRAPVIDPARWKPGGQIGPTRPTAETGGCWPASTPRRRLGRASTQEPRAKHLHALASRIEAADMTACAITDDPRDGQALSRGDRRDRQLRPVFRYYAEMARDEAGKVAGTTQAGSFQYARYEPLGVSVHIMPFNFPILLMCWTVAASLAAGNACVVKPAEATTLSTLEFMGVFDDLPEDLIACLPGGAGVGEALVASAADPCGRLHRVGPRRRRPWPPPPRADEARGDRGGRVGPDDHHRRSRPARRGRRRRGHRGLPHVGAGLHLDRADLCGGRGVHDAFVARLRRETEHLRIGNGLGGSRSGRW
jgi:hypothetical protein